MAIEKKNDIRVLVVDDSAFIRKVLTETLNSAPGIIVIDSVVNGKEAVNAAMRLKPDVITMDLAMPVMDGIQAVKEIMAYCPTRIMILTSVESINSKNYIPFDAINSGALEVLAKKDFNNPLYCAELIEKIKFLSRIKVIRHPYEKLKRDSESVQNKIESFSINSMSSNRIVAMASSTGGPEILLKVLEALPGKFPCPIVIVQHIIGDFLKDMVLWMNSQCKIKIKVAENYEQLQNGIVYFAPPDLQMRITSDEKVKLSKESEVNGFQPSGDVLLKSVAQVYGNRAIGVILTGMGADGAMGIKAISDNKGMTIAQNEQSCVVFGMPKVAIDLGGVDKILHADDIAKGIIEALIRSPNKNT